MRSLIALTILAAAMPLGGGYGGFRLSDSFAMFLFFGALAFVGVAGVAACMLQRVEAKAYWIPGIMAAIGIMGCAAALDGR
jgi:hypothetical protein